MLLASDVYLASLMPAFRQTSSHAVSFSACCRMKAIGREAAAWRRVLDGKITGDE
jgi:hypothetical protein